MSDKVIIGMSGGVDSSVAAYLFQQQGCDVMGVTLRLLSSCPAGSEALSSLSDEGEAQAVASHLGIPHRTLDFSGQFHTQVIAPFIQCYEQGRTPNPCIRCNRFIKFQALLEQARSLGYDAIATGHYARIEQDPGGRWLLKKAIHREKDQSYVLYSVTQEQLAHTRLPLGGLSKEEVRELALSQGLVNARKRDSQDICFVPDGDYASFIQRQTGREYPSGPFEDRQGRVLGTHRGIIRYTLGQRKGLGLALPTPMYVFAKDMDRNAVILSSNEELFRRDLDAEDLFLIACDRIPSPLRVKAKVRYSQLEQWATVEQTGNDRLHVVFDQPQRAITPGQAVVLYDGDTVVGGGTIL